MSNSSRKELIRALSRTLSIWKGASEVTISTIYDLVNKALKELSEEAMFVVEHDIATIVNVAYALYKGYDSETAVLYLKTEKDFKEEAKQFQSETMRKEYVKLALLTAGQVAEVMSTESYNLVLQRLKKMKASLMFTVIIAIRLTVSMFLAEEDSNERFRKLDIEEIIEFIKAYEKYQAIAGTTPRPLKFYKDFVRGKIRERLAQLYKFDQLVKKFSKLLAKKKDLLRPERIGISVKVGKKRPGDPISAVVKSDLMGLAADELVKAGLISEEEAKIIKLWNIKKIVNNEVRVPKHGRRLFPILMIDVSGSMEGPPLVVAMAIGIALIQAAGDGMVVLFDVGVRHVATGYKEAMKILLTLDEQTLGGTNIWNSLKQIAPTIKRVKDRQPYLFLISDMGAAPPSVNEFADFLKETNLERNMYFIAIGGEYDYNEWYKALRPLIKRGLVKMIHKPELLNHLRSGWDLQLKNLERIINDFYEAMRGAS